MERPICQGTEVGLWPAASKERGLSTTTWVSLEAVLPQDLDKTETPANWGLLRDLEPQASTTRFHVVATGTGR